MDDRPAPPRPVRTSKLVSEGRKKNRVRKIGTLVGHLMARKGYASGMSDEALRKVIADALPEAIRQSFRVGNINQGVLQIFVGDSATLQEINFHKRRILKSLDGHQQTIKNVRFRIG